MLFIKVCELVMDLFSKVFFKLHFFKPLLSLSADKVPNIRLRLCAILPRLKSLIKLPKDSLLLQQLESCVKALIADEKDRDVTYAVRRAIEELDKIEVSEEPISRRSSCIEISLDMQDRFKEEQERQQLEMEFSSKQKEGRNIHVPNPSENAQKTGKIPVRKSGTLPKQSKGKQSEMQQNEKNSSQSKSLRILKKERRISSPALNVDIQKLSTLITQGPKNEAAAPASVLKSTTTTCNIPKSSRPCGPAVRTWPRQKPRPSSLIPKQPLDRCPSPMPQPRRFLDHLAGAEAAKKNAKAKENVLRSKTSGSSREGSPYFQKRKSLGCVAPSPETPRRSATFSNLQIESRIPTPKKLPNKEN